MKVQITRNWWMFTLNGILAILYGVLALFVPAEIVVTVAMYTGVAILIFGIIMLATAIYRIKKKMHYGVLIAQSVIAIVLGSLILIYTRETVSFFVTMMGIWAILSGIMLLVILVNLNTELSNKNMLLVNALVSLLFGVILLINPFKVAIALVILSGLLALGFGIILILFSLQLRRLGRRSDQIDLTNQSEHYDH
jgi:uncharacterized membrane protein HdeD (DUF308 family)